jgi:cellulose synthase/poly-beta-1,6-N-acetylglucosamine synthase-like glycosyltransferase
MTDLPVSVVIVSRGRPRSLMRTLMGISQIQYWNFEVVVVADPEGIKSAAAMPFADDLKLVPFDTPNISEARNLGLSHAAGEIIAYIDDDAVPEPMWLRHLVAPASRKDVAAMGGYVRGRNGISFQWKAASLDGQGLPHALSLDPEKATVMH